MTPACRIASCVAASLALLLQGCANPERSFEQARNLDTREAYAEFVARFPAHPLAADAEARVDDLDFAAASATDTVDALTAYLGQHPTARHAAEAATRIEQLHWQTAAAAGTAAACREFFRLHPEPALATPAGGSVELGPGVVVSEITTRSVPTYEGHGLPGASAFEHWVTGGTLTMSVASFGREKPAASGRFLEVALWFENRSDEEEEVWFSDAEGVAFAAPLIVGDSEPVQIAGLDLPGSSIADTSLITTLEGKLGVRLAKGERTWFALVYDLPGQPGLGVLLLGRTPFPVVLPK